MDRRPDLLLDPPLLVPVGRLAIDAVLGAVPLADAVGRRFREESGRVVIPLPHPSGASSWLNQAPHRRLLGEAVALICGELGVARRPS